MKLNPLLVMAASALCAGAAIASSPAVAQTAAYTGTGATRGAVTGQLNIGREFTVSGSGIDVSALGIFDLGGDGLVSNHNVTLFSGIGTSANPLLSLTVPAGTLGTLIDGFRFTPLDGSIHLAAGSYSIIGYGLNSASGGDAYGDGGGIPTGPVVTSINFDPFQFTTNSSPAYPTGGDSNNHSSVSFLYTATGAVPEPATWAMMLVGFGAIGFGLRRRPRQSVRITYA